MPSALTHAAAACAIGAWFDRPRTPAVVWVLGATGAALPDIDVVGYWAGIPYDSVLGHRGLTHSVFFAAVVAAVGAALLRRRTGSWSARRLWLFLFLATASHGILDAFTDGGLGIALLSPFSADRVFAPVRPIAVAPLSVTGFFTGRGLRVFRSELLWVWVPALAAGTCGHLWRRGRPAFAAT